MKGTSRILTFAKGRQPSRIFYGWWIVVAGIVAAALSTGFAFHGVSNLFPPLAREFGWSRTAISGGFALARVEHGLLGPIEGFLVDRAGPRRIMLIGIPIMASGFLLLTVITNQLMFYGALMLVALGSSLGFATPISAAVANWFRRKRGRAFGLFWTGHGLASIPVILLGWLIVTVGWRQAAAIVALLIIVVGVPIALIMRHRPEDYGMHPDGEAPASEGSDSAAAASLVTPSSEQEFTPRQALKTPAMWFLSFSVAARQMLSAGITLHFVIFMTDKGFSQLTGATLLFWMVLATTPGRLVLASVGDYLDKRLVMTACMGIMSVAVLFMGHASTLWAFMPPTIVFAFAWGGLSALPQPLRADYFGRRHFATIQGFQSMIQLGGMLTGPLMLGYIYDTTGSYTLGFSIMAGVAALGMVLIFMARKPPPPAPARAGQGFRSDVPKP